MASPFPGMDPYLEGEMWQEFHQTLANAIRAQLMPHLVPKYVALLAKRFTIEYPSETPTLDIMGFPARSIYPDVHVVAPPGGAALRPMSAATGTTAPTIELPGYEEVPQLGIEIRDVADRRLITAIEILSPANKIGAGARDYQDRRLSLSRALVHLLEFDLLRVGTRIPLHGQPPLAPYYAYLGRWERRPYTQVWAIQLREPLPIVPVPLLAPDPDVRLDLQAALDSCFDLVGYNRLLAYAASPPPPDFSAADDAWVAALLQTRGYRPAPTP